MNQNQFEPQSFYGKYRGTVTNNVDPLGIGRVQVQCPAVFGSGTQNWALPSAPYAGDGVGLLLVPPVGANVWVEFEGGNAQIPILGGCFWAKGQTPAPGPALPQVKVLKTDSLTVTLDDTVQTGGLTITVTGPAVSAPLTLTATGSGIELSVGSSKVVLSGTSVSINDGALEVT